MYLLFSFLAETGREVPSEPPRADSFRVSRPRGAGVQPAPARTRDHAPLQTPAAGLLALVTHQADEQHVLLLILCFTPCPSSHLSPPPSSDSSKVPPVVTQLQLLIPTDHTLLKSAKGTHTSKTFSHCLTFLQSSSIQTLLKEKVQPSTNELFFQFACFHPSSSSLCIF